MDPLVHPLAAAAGVLAAYFAAYGFAHWVHARFDIGRHSAGPRIGCIDGLRGYLALSVLMHHFIVWQGVLLGKPWAAPPANITNNLGQAAVVLFFMVTGALFYARIRPAPGHPPVDWRALYISRLFRLVPLYWFAVACVAIIAILRRGGVLGDPAALLGSLIRWALFMGQPDIAGYSPTGQIIAYAPWTLRYEWAFYATLPVLAVAVQRVMAARLPAVLVPLSLLALCAVDAFVLNGGYLEFAPAFACGMLAIEAAQRPALAQWLRTRAAALLGSAALIAAMTLFHQSLTAWLPIALLAVAFAPVVAGNSYFGFLQRPASRVLGDLSYSIYLLHGIVLSMVLVEGLRRFGLPEPLPSLSPMLWAALPVLAVIVTALSLVTFLMIERPAIAFGKRLARRLSPSSRSAPEPYPGTVLERRP